MVKYDKQAKVNFVSGLTGSSVSDINSVSLALPVRLPNCQSTQADHYIAARCLPLVGPPVAPATLYTLHQGRPLRRYPSQLRRRPLRNHNLRPIIMALQLAPRSTHPCDTPDLATCIFPPTSLKATSRS